MTLVLGIESSCDETAAAVVRDGKLVLSSIVASQADLHAPFRGVVPEIACRSHLEVIIPTIETALRDANVSANELDAIAVTKKPGLIGALLVGLTAAKAIAWYYKKPIIGVDHLAAHLYAATMETEPARHPAIALVASGGHTALYQFISASEFELIGSTNDDAAGEAFDKVAALLGLPYPGGPSIEKAAEGVDVKPFIRANEHFQKPRVSSSPLDFSFSGLKTAVRYKIMPPHGERRILDLTETAKLAAMFQHAAVEHLISSTEAAIEKYSAKSVLAGGGVACNKLLRARLAEICNKRNLLLHLPRPALCSDNAAMIAGLGTALYNSGNIDSLELTATASGGAS
ncbi:MAG: tRNA (adenosine(37)-N6)-threonylcarbamoyltransferase complex transferase subunit TsaD [Planctomycetota bacterium]